MRVIIIGAGIGGACLAHGLRKSGIDVALYERNAAAANILPGYGIHINVFGQQAMQECLPESNWLAFKAKARPIGGLSRFYDENLRLLAEPDGVHLKEGQSVREHRLSISRTELRDVLLDGLLGDANGNGAVAQWNKEFVRYETLPNGRMRVHFADGSQDEGDVLVGADGCNSRVRKQYLPHIERLNVGVTIIIGRTRLTDAIAAALPPSLTDGSPNSIVPAGPDWMFVSIWRAPVDTSAPSASAVIDSFVVWAYVAADESFPENLERLSPSDLCDLVNARIAKWDGRLRSLVDQCELGSVSVVPLRSMPHLPDWNAGAVTLLGDAIHNMTPMAGIGAVTALRDARLLTRALPEVAAGRIDLASAIAGYEQEMRAYANEAVALSLRNARNAGASTKFQRASFRTFLRVAQVVPPVKRMLFPVGR